VVVVEVEEELITVVEVVRVDIEHLQLLLLVHFHILLLLDLVVLDLQVLVFQVVYQADLVDGHSLDHYMLEQAEAVQRFKMVPLEMV
jgi:hypothetical protein